MPALFFIGIALWFIFGNPKVTVANWFWEYEAAPWETVDAFYYYLDDSNKERIYTIPGLETVQSCRDQAYAAAARNKDPAMLRSSYECGIQKLRDFAGIGVYRTTVR